MKRIILGISLCFFYLTVNCCYGDVVINEIHYHPSEGIPYYFIPRVSGPLILPNQDIFNHKNNRDPEFIELYNPTDADIDLSNYQFTQGISYTFPEGSLIKSNDFVIVVKDMLNDWKIQEKTFGPYEGKLSNDGETVTLCNSSGQIIDQVKYTDELPWPRGADGYGFSLEKISSELPSNDVHSWRTSLTFDGSPLKKNTVFNVSEQPLILSMNCNPEYPKSTDSVQIEASFDSPEIIQSVTIHLIAKSQNADIATVTTAFAMSIKENNLDSITFESEIIPYPSQTLVRCWFEVRRVDERKVQLPHPGDPFPYFSYFVYDDEIHSKLPLLWMFPREQDEGHCDLLISGAVIKPTTLDHVLLFDGARIEPALDGNKIKFLKNNDYLGIRNLKIVNDPVPKEYTFTTLYNLLEDFSFSLFQDFPALSPKCVWYRLMQEGKHFQVIAIERPNEHFFESHGRNKNGNIYKAIDPIYIKKSNVYEPDDDLQELLQLLNNDEERQETIETCIDQESFLCYDVVSVFISHWDGYHKNHVLYHNPDPSNRWEIIPWDLDNTLGCNFFVYDDNLSKLSINYPLTGNGEEGNVSRPLRGMITALIHKHEPFHQTYIERLAQALKNQLAEERLLTRVDEKEALLLDDIKLMEEYTGENEDKRRGLIQEGYDNIRKFISDRHEYLNSVLPVGVDDFSLY